MDLPMAIDYLAELNDSQQAAVVCLDAPSLVIAGAGSGKTRVLTYKIAYLLENGYAPYEILALTFTNKAASEMRQRIATLVGEERARYLWMGTFHSIFARILRMECDVVGFTSDYTIYDAQDSQTVIKHIVKEQGLDEKRYKASIVAARISDAKNNMLGSREYAMSAYLIKQDKERHLGELHRIFSIYEQKLRASNAMDFDDLLLNTYRLFFEHPDVKAKYQEKFKYVLVDEYQDTNRVQHQIVKQLTEVHHQVCVVGDDAQSIYSFRGAVVDNILSFQHLYPNTKVFKLERNYRSTQNIVAAAGSVIAKNRKQIPKAVFSKRDEGELIEVCEAYSDKEEAAIVARRIDALRHSMGLTWNGFVVLYRTNSQSRTFEEEFRRQGFPYHIVGGMSFYQRKEVKDAVAYLRLAVNLCDEPSWRRIINVPARGIGQTTVDKISHCAVERGVALWDVASEPARFGLDVNAGTAQRLLGFAQMMLEAHEMAKDCDAHQVALHLVQRSGLWSDIFAGHEPEDISRQQNLQELLDGIATFVEEAAEAGEGTSLTEYLQNISLLSDVDEGDDLTDERITLMTMHAAKGLEFKVVFIVGMEEGLFPSDTTVHPSDIEEERRLFYVAMTRAEERLFLTWSHTRMRYGHFESNDRSRFLTEIDKQYLKTKRSPSPSFSPRRTEAKPERPAVDFNKFRPLHSAGAHPQVQRSSVSQGLPHEQQTEGSLKVGDRVEHDRFGIGIIRQFEGSGIDTKAIVDFQNTGEKRLLLRFAKLKPVGDLQM